MEVTYTYFTCPSCGVGFAITSSYVKQLKDAQRSMHCPNGHQNIFPKEKMEKNLAETQAENVRLKEDIVRLRHELEMGEARRSG